MPLLVPPPHYIAVETDSRVRVFCLADRSSARPALSTVTTLRTGSAAAALPEALNRAAWTGDTRALDEILEELPAAIASACRDSLKGLAHPSAYPPVTDDEMPVIVAEVYYGREASDALDDAHAAQALDLGFVVVNHVDEGIPEFVGYTLSGSCEVNPTAPEDWWPFPEGAALLHRRRSDDEGLEDILSDPRWETHTARLYSVWIRDRDVSGGDADGLGAEHQWIADFFDAPLEPVSNQLLFIASEDWEGDFGDSYVTERNRFLVWLALRDMAADLDSLTSDWGAWESMVRDDMPAAIQSQSREWWRQLYRSAARLSEAFRRGDYGDMRPRTPAEEALLFLATRDDYVGLARDELRFQASLQQQHRGLPTHEDDGAFDEILGELAGDTDVEIAWDPDFLALADPDGHVNRSLGMGDYRPDAWHRWFAREIPTELPPIE